MSYSRNTIVAQAQSWIGCKESDGSHKQIIDVYNAHTPLARGYKVKYTDAWCATFVSAVSIKCGYTAIIPTECSCSQMITLLKNLDEWVEDDSYTPSAGDLILYDWDDTTGTTSDNTGTPDHIGIVEKVSAGKITVIEGNMSNAVGRRTIAVNGKYIRGFGVPKYDGTSSASASASSGTGTSSGSGSAAFTAGMAVTLKSTALYKSSSAASKSNTLTGTYYIWSVTQSRSRIRITTKAEYAGVSGKITGWVNVSDITAASSCTSSAASSTAASGAPTYTVGKNYTLKVDALRVRKTPGDDGKILTYSELTSNAKAHAYTTGTLKKNTTVTCKGTTVIGSDIWMKIPSGYIAAYYQGKVYVG